MKLQLPTNAMLVTPDSVSMSTNIDTKVHTLKQYTQKCNHLLQHHEQQAVMEALEMVMNNNIFQFGDTYWLQIDGTAMGVSPSCVYATIYFA
jgi:hypothetical protein